MTLLQSAARAAAKYKRKIRKVGPSPRCDQLLNLSVAGVFAQNPLKMHYSGSNVATTINLQDGTVTDEELFEGKGALGAFTYRELHLTPLLPSLPTLAPAHIS